MNLFPNISSHISIISPYIVDITDNKGSLMVFAKPHIPSSRFNNFKIPCNIQIIPFEINLKREKWLFASIYNAPSQKNKYFLWYLTNLLEFCWTRYEKVIILGDFNTLVENKVMISFSSIHSTIWWNRIHDFKVTEVRAYIY